MKRRNWMIALLGIWEFGDILALFTPGFGKIQAFVWNHSVVGLILAVVGFWAARTSNTGTARTMNWIAVAAGVWLIVSSYVLRYPVVTAGLWNDIIVGAMVAALGIWAIRALPPATE